MKIILFLYFLLSIFCFNIYSIEFENIDYMKDAYKFLQKKKEIDREIEKSPEIYKELIEPFKSDLKIIYKVLKKRPNLAKYLPNRHKKSINVAIVVAKKRMKYLKYFDRSIFENRDFFYRVLREKNRVAKFIKGKLKKDYAFVKKILYINSFCFEFFPDDMKKDEKIAKIACYVSGANYKYLSDELRDKEDVIIETFRSRSYGGEPSLKFASNRLRKSKEIVKKAIYRSYLAYPYIHEELKNDKEFMKEIDDYMEYRIGKLPIKKTYPKNYKGKRTEFKKILFGKFQRGVYRKGATKVVYVDKKGKELKKEYVNSHGKPLKRLGELKKGSMLNKDRSVKPKYTIDVISIIGDRYNKRALIKFIKNRKSKLIEISEGFKITDSIKVKTIMSDGIIVSDKELGVGIYLIKK